jgi:hypothetical protein
MPGKKARPGNKIKPLSGHLAQRLIFLWKSKPFSSFSDFPLSCGHKAKPYYILCFYFFSLKKNTMGGNFGQKLLTFEGTVV